MKSRNYKWLILVATLVSLIFVVTNVTAKKPDKTTPSEDAVFTADSDLIVGPIDSYSVDHDWQIVFRHTEMNLSGFTVSYDSGVACPPHNPEKGIMVLRPKSRKNPMVARLDYWFQSELESGELVTHLFLMEGVFDEPGNWPPSETDPVTTLTFNQWEVAAENKWAQRQDCAGGTTEEDFPDGPWIISVARQE